MLEPSFNIAIVLQRKMPTAKALCGSILEILCPQTSNAYGSINFERYQPPKGRLTYGAATGGGPVTQGSKSKLWTLGATLFGEECAMNECHSWIWNTRVIATRTYSHRFFSVLGAGEFEVSCVV